MKYNKAIKGKLFKYFKQRLNLKPSTKGWYRSNCPLCGGNYCFGVNISLNRTKCFKCGEQKTPIEALMEMENLATLNDARNFINLQEQYDQYEDYQVVRYERKEVKLPESFRLIINKEGILGKSAQNYIKKRGFDITKMGMQGVGYCLKGDYAGYIVFPFYKRGKLVFFQGRKFIGEGPKMKNPMNETFGIGKTQLIYNQDALFMYNEIRVVESITNALTLGDSAVAILGKKISPYQLSMLINCPCKRVTIILDSDAILEAALFAMQLVHYKKVRVILMPKDKDVNDLGKTETRTLIMKTPWQTYNQLMKLKNEAGTIYTHN